MVIDFLQKAVSRQNHVVGLEKQTPADFDEARRMICLPASACSSRVCGGIASDSKAGRRDMWDSRKSQGLYRICVCQCCGLLPDSAGSIIETSSSGIR